VCVVVHDKEDVVALADIGPVVDHLFDFAIANTGKAASVGSPIEGSSPASSGARRTVWLTGNYA
jgi:hypothetical protein